MKVLILGCNGMAGSTISTYFQEQGHDVYGLAMEKSVVLDSEHSIVGDATKFDDLDEIIKNGKYDYVINCIGILNKATEVNKSLSITLNSLLPHHLVNVCKDLDTRVIHMSTDCVFSGAKGSYTENSQPDSETFYGRTKALGEIVDAKNLTIRTSIVGPDINKNGIGLFHWFMKQRGEINGYSQVIWSGVTTIELAKIMELCARKQCTGIVNMVNNQTISKFDLLDLFKKYMGKDITINRFDSVKEDKSLVRTNFELDYSVPSYEQMVKEMSEWIANHKSLYTEYMGEEEWVN